MTGPFYAEGGILAILRDEEHYRSSLRMYPYRDGWLIEGFETRPDSRKKGFGRRLYKMLMERLEQDGDIVLYAYTGKKNAASIAAHQSAGFERVCEYWEEDDGTRNEKEVTLIYRTAKK
jgi:GNAT superfamily N-acetyltransferase